MYECITSILLLEQERTIYSMIKDMCLSVWRHQRHIIDKKKNMMENQIRNKNDKIPRARIWTLTTDCNMVQSNALPTELRGTCQYLRLNLNSCFRLSMHCKDQAKKQKCYFIGRKESPLLWFAIDLISKKKPSPLTFVISMKDYLFSFIRESQWG